MKRHTERVTARSTPTPRVSPAVWLFGACMGASATACTFDGDVVFGDGGAGPTTGSSASSMGGGGSVACTSVDDCTGEHPACRAWACVDGACIAEAVPDGATVACYEGPPGTVGVGACAAGEQTCTDGEPGPCKGQILPSVEECNDKVDQSCDGVVECDGQPVWTRRLPLGSPPRATPAQDGGLWLVGAHSATTTAPELAFGGACAPLSAPEGDAFGFVARFDATGRCASAAIVATSPGAPQGINPIAMVERDDGSLWSSWSFGSPITVGSSTPTPAALDGLLVAMTPDLQIDWSVTVSGSGSESLGSLSRDPGGLVVGGTSSSAMVEIVDSSGSPTSVAGGVDGVFAPILVGLSDEGELRFVRRSVLSGTDPSASLAPVRGTASGSLVVANVGGAPVSFNWQGAASASPTQGGVLATRFGVDGSPGSALVFDYPGSDFASSSLEVDGSTFLLGGSTFGGVGAGGCPDIAQKPNVFLGYWALLGPGSCSVGTLEAAEPVVGTGDPFVRVEQLDRDASGALFLGATYRGVLDGVDPQVQGVHLRKHAGTGPGDKSIWTRSFEPGFLIVPLRAYFADPATGGAYFVMRCSAPSASLDAVLVEGDTSCSELTPGVYVSRLRP